VAHRKRAWDEGAWVREAALAFASRVRDEGDETGEPS
jgi:ring-1,2-phenylacetyl-CoA epoxidase subunit PaaA